MILCCENECTIGCSEWITIIISFFISAFWALLLVFIKPRLRIENICVDESKRKFKAQIKNIGMFDAINLRVEICAINKETNETVHLPIDIEEFNVLPHKNDNTRVFKTNAIDQDRFNRFNTPNYYIRVRVHSSHSFSGFGKAIEKTNK
jgi:hypothetical protein